MRLGIDLDGVVANFNAGWMARYNAAYGTELRPEMVKQWNGMLGLTRFDTMQEFWGWAEGGDGPSIFRDLPTFSRCRPRVAAIGTTPHDRDSHHKTQMGGTRHVLRGSRRSTCQHAKCT